VKVKQTVTVVVEDFDKRQPLFRRLLAYEPELGRIDHSSGDTVMALVVGVVKMVQVGVDRMAFKGGRSEFEFILAQHNKAITHTAFL
jgi:hypothetical protein